MGCLTFLVLSGPYTYQNTHTLVNLANAALEKHHDVKVFFFADGVYNTNKHVKVEEGDVNLPMELEKLKEKGVEMAVCGACAAYRGITTENMIAGADIAGLAVFGEYFEESDRVIVFGM